MRCYSTEINIIYSLPVDSVGVGAFVVSVVVSVAVSVVASVVLIVVAVVVVDVEWCLGQISLSSASLTIAAGCCKPVEI